MTFAACVAAGRPVCLLLLLMLNQRNCGMLFRYEQGVDLAEATQLLRESLEAADVSEQDEQDAVLAATQTMTDGLLTVSLSQM